MYEGEISRLCMCVHARAYTRIVYIFFFFLAVTKYTGRLSRKSRRQKEKKRTLPCMKVPKISGVFSKFLNNISPC